MSNAHFPFQAVLMEEPDSTSQGRVTVGQEYTVTGMAGSCFTVIADDGESAMIWRGRFIPATGA